MPKSKKQPPAVPDKSPATAGIDEAQSRLLAWAHQGDEEGLKKISDFVVKEKNKDLREFARLAYEEAEYFYYSPRNEKEEREFLLAKMIHEREARLWEIMAKADAAKFELQKLDLDRRVHRKIMSTIVKRKKASVSEEWQYRFSEDYCKMVRHRLQKFEDDIFYESAWLGRAKGMITAKRYQKIPAEIWEHVHWDGEGSTFWIDGNDGYEEDGGRCCDCAPCPYCGSYDTVPIGDKTSSVEDVPF